MKGKKRIQPKPSNVLSNVSFGILAVIGAGYAVCFFALVVLRVDYQFELEWMEGGMVDHVARVLAGSDIYVKPSLDFIPYIYTPLYYYVCAVPSLILGPGFLPLRLVSVASTIGVLILLYFFVKRETGRVLPALVAPGLFAASFGVCGYWFDLGRVDTFALLILLGGTYVLRSSSSRNYLILAGLLMGLAFLAKQSTLLVAGLLTVWTFYTSRWRALWYVGSAALIVVTSTVWFDHIQSGWYSYYVFTLPNRHTLDYRILIEFWTKDIGSKLPVLALAAIAYGWYLRKRENWQDLCFWTALSAGCVLSSWSMRVFAGGFDNALIPASAALAIVAGLLIGRITKSKEQKGPVVSDWLVLVVAFAFAVQYVLFGYDPKVQVPTEKDQAYGRQFIERMSRVQGDVLLPWHGYLPVLAGKRSCAHKMALAEIKAGDPGLYADLSSEIVAEIHSGRYGAIILNAEWFSEAVSTDYRNLGDPFPDRSMFYPVTGLPTRPHFWFEPKPK